MNYDIVSDLSINRQELIIKVQVTSSGTRRPRLDAEIGVGKAISILGPPGPRGGAKRQAVVRLIVAKLSLAAGH